ncbi:MAG: DNA-binding domain-containing protein, partial [Tumebacillaceae bacterium]
TENPRLSGEQLQREIKAMEQRLRRMILQALSNLASLGLTDYANPMFEHYAPRLFDFQEVRLRMQEIRDGEKNTKCRLNIKKFLAALHSEALALYQA